MRTKFKYLLLLLIINVKMAAAQENPGAEIYLLTCGPGTEIYSVYGHSALRVVIPGKNSDHLILPGNLQRAGLTIPSE
jgi:hypothetical protein